ncbi:Transcriptional regulator, GntR family [Marinobacterium lacunae]|uniref:Transcriptional regulator, GntR family n=1 Tax=Marinobacterium lacunae TaxID=1232683 RepID=A0A081G4I1_9GAMM|nr:GntR family transcriptional regulator [Marinobacterium lacunae]KEA65686.1 Transcriptional regulator, GntR family [Marinobacterium lacunae]
MKPVDVTQLLQQSSLVSDRSRSAVDRVYDDLHRRIVDLELPPDTTLTRGELCSDYDVSLTPVREALLRLEQLGLVKIYPQSRTIVTRIEVSRLKQSHFLREALECEVVRRLALEHDAALITKLHAIIDLQEQCAADPEQIATFSKLDELFHEILFKAVDQLPLFTLSRSMLGHMARVRRLDLPSEGKTRNVIEVHRHIVDSIASGDPQQAMEVMREHLQGTIARIGTLRQAYPDFFTD